MSSSSSNNPRPSSSTSTGAAPSTTTRSAAVAVRKGQKRAAVTPITNGDAASWEDKSNDFLCPICFELFTEASITNCGHTFCHNCILSALGLTSKCPKCGVEVDKEKLVPNHVITQLVAKQSVGKVVKNDIAEASQSVGKVVGK